MKSKIAESIKLKNKSFENLYETLSDKDGKFSFQVNNAFTGYDVYVEVYLFLEHPDRPGVYVVKRAYLAFVVSNKPDAPVQQEQLYRVNLLPQ